MSTAHYHDNPTELLLRDCERRLGLARDDATIAPVDEDAWVHAYLEDVPRLIAEIRELGELIR